MAMLDEQITPVDQAVKAEAQRDKMALLLQTQPGGKQVASYLGLIPREHSSGGRQKLGAITKQATACCACC
jgi:transposase